MDRTQINSDFGKDASRSAQVHHSTAVKAAKCVVSNIPDSEEAKIILDMLGLIPPQPGFEALDSVQENRKRKDKVRKSSPEYKARHAERQRELYQERKRKKEEELERLGATPEEIGEDEIAEM